MKRSVTSKFTFLTDKKIGIIGSGQVAQVLATGFQKYGYDVMMGTRDALRLSDWKNNSKGKTGSFEEAAALETLSCWR